MMEKIKTEGGPAKGELQNHEDFIHGQKIKIERKKQEIRGLKAEAEEKQTILVQKAQDTKVMEKLKGKQYEKFHKEARRREVKEADDIVVMRTRRGE